MKNIGVILAGGSGRRVGSDIPKQFLCVAGRTILEHTLERFDSHPQIDEIVVIVAEKEMDRTRALILESNFSKVTHIVKGGQERYHSSLAALNLFPEEELNILIHDAVRPMVSEQMITDCIRALAEYPACTTAVPSTDTILISDFTHTIIKDIPVRNFLYNVQTPQGFRKSILQKAYQDVLKDKGFHPTDDCGIIKKYMPEVKIKIIAGHSTNLKITYAEDLITAEKLLSNNTKSDNQCPQS